MDISWFYYGIEEFKVITIRNFIIKLIGILFIFMFVKDSSDLSIYIWCQVLVLFFGNLSLWLSIRKFIDKPIFTIGGCLIHLGPVILLFLPQCIDSVYMTLDKIMLGNISNIAEVGLYSQADKIVKICVTVITSMGLVMSPRIANSFASGETVLIRKYLHSSFKFLFTFSIPMVFGINAICNNFVGWFFGPEYSDVTLLIKFLSPTIFLLGINSIIGWQYLLSVKREKEFIYSVSIGAISNVILNMILIKKLDSLGAVLASVCSMFIMSVLNLIFIRKELSFRYLLKGIYKPLFAAGVMNFIVSYLGSYLSVSFFSTIVQSIAGIVVYFLILIICKDETIRGYINKLSKRS